jgi:signal transduction histidine kinase
VTIAYVELIARERDRLLQRSARAIGLGGVLISLVCLAVPGMLHTDTFIATLPFYAIIIFALYRLGSSRSIGWVALGVAAGIAILVTVRFPLGVRPAASFGAAIVPLAAGGIAAFGIVLINTTRRRLFFLLSFALTATASFLALPSKTFFTPQLCGILLGWVLSAVFAYWLSASIPRAARRIYSIGRAHRAERKASELEAQRRQGARLLHDTVLATLTLLAHSGVGVAESAMQHQAGEDARLLRQLRLGATPAPQSSGGYNLEPVEESALGTTLESVKQRFGRMGLEVSWHGTGQVLLPSDVLDAFLLALAECLENVRRHAGVTDAHVTITTDDSTVRAMVTDAGVGFDIANIDEARLGFKESVVARLRDVGGNARLFSSPGNGTTVVLEVPK